jgi:hypothetical protein
MVSWRHEFGHNAIAVGDQHRFTALGKADILAELVFKNL